MKASETELGNIRDMSADAAEGNKTLPMVIGVENTKVCIVIGETISVLLFAYISNSRLFLAVLVGYLLLIGGLLNSADQTVGRVAKRSRLCRWYSQLRGHS